MFRSDPTKWKRAVPSREAWSEKKLVEVETTGELFLDLFLF